MRAQRERAAAVLVQALDELGRCACTVACSAFVLWPSWCEWQGRGGGASAGQAVRLAARHRRVCAAALVGPVRSEQLNDMASAVADSWAVLPGWP